MRGVYRLLRLNSLVRGHRAKFLAAYLAHTAGFRHLAVRFDPVMACNLRCRMCHFSNEAFVRGTKGAFSPEEVERLASMFFPLSLLVVFGCGAEPTLYRDYPELVRLAKRHRVPNVGLVTNAQLLRGDDIDRLIDYGLDELVVSVHGVNRDTYEHFMPGASFDRLLANLDALEAARTRRQGTGPALRINYTVNDDNVTELESFFERFGRFSITTLQVRPIMDFGGAYRGPLGRDALAVYGRIAARLRSICEERRVTALITSPDTTYVTRNDRAAVLHAVQRHIRPGRVWQDTFDWRNETYREYCRRIGWGRHLLRCARSPIDEVLATQHKLSATYAARYEVSL
jgi:molybdenum cofactor biosynthesis enzyme MoaA